MSERQFKYNPGKRRKGLTWILLLGVAIMSATVIYGFIAFPGVMQSDGPVIIILLVSVIAIASLYLVAAGKRNIKDAGGTVRLSGSGLLYRAGKLPSPRIVFVPFEGMLSVSRSIEPDSLVIEADNGRHVFLAGGFERMDVYEEFCRIVKEAVSVSAAPAFTRPGVHSQDEL